MSAQCCKCGFSVDCISAQSAAHWIRKSLSTLNPLTVVLPLPVPFKNTKVPDLYDPRTQWAGYIINAIKAKELFIKDVNYIVKNNEVGVLCVCLGVTNCLVVCEGGTGRGRWW